MSGNLLDMAWSYLNNSALMEKLSRAVGLSPEKTQEVLKAVVPTTLAGTVQTASSDAGAKRLFDMLGQDRFDGSMLGNLGSRLEGGGIDEMAQSGKGILGNLFGGKLGAIEDLLTRFSGVGKGPVSLLLGAAAPFVMNLLGKAKNEQGLSAGGLRELLLSQKDSIAKFTPPGLASVMGLSSLADLGGTAAAAKEKIGAYAGEARGEAQERAPSAYPSPEPRAPAASSAGRWLGIGLACLALLGVIWFMRGRSSYFASESAAPIAAPTAADHITGTPVSNVVAIDLPTGQRIQLEPGSAAMSVVEFIRKAPAGSERFALTEVTFASSGSDPTADSKPALDKLATVLKAYPNTNVRIRSYVPAGADEASGQQLAADRADHVKTYLVERGVPADRIQAEASDQPSTQPAVAAEIVIERVGR
jgi:OmpA-OmpF porin, OOP family